jgi:hypothetical protein
VKCELGPCGRGRAWCRPGSAAAVRGRRVGVAVVDLDEEGFVIEAALPFFFIEAGGLGTAPDEDFSC